MKKKPDPYKLDKSSGDFEWTEKDFKAARPIRQLKSNLPEQMARLSRKVGRPTKEQRYEKATISFPPDILAWLKAPGPGYQTRLHKMLRAIMETTRVGT